MSSMEYEVIFWKGHYIATSHAYPNSEFLVQIEVDIKASKMPPLTALVTKYFSSWNSYNFITSLWNWDDYENLEEALDAITEKPKEDEDI